MPVQSRATTLGEPSSLITGKKITPNLQNLMSTVQQLKPSVLLAESFVFFSYHYQISNEDASFAPGNGILGC